VHYETVSELLSYLGTPKSPTKTVHRYMNPTKLYKGRYKFDSLEDFQGQITGYGDRKS
jgi:hypothetical protein